MVWYRTSGELLYIHAWESRERRLSTESTSAGTSIACNVHLKITACMREEVGAFAGYILHTK
jgi:hypothetical protein